MSDGISERLETGDLDGAIAALNAEVRQNPTDAARRARLVELLCFAGTLERADRLLDALQHQDSGLALGVALYRQLVRAEEARQQFYAEGRLPEFVGRPDDHDQLYLRAVLALRDGAPAEAAALLAEAERRRIPLGGTADGAAFDDFRDLDDVAATHLDVLTSTGKFYWIPFRRIERIALHRPERHRDLLWRRASLAVQDGPEGEIFLPTVYPAGAAPASGSHRLGRATDFTGGEGEPVRGMGLRTFLVGADTRTILEIGTLDFAAGR